MLLFSAPSYNCEQTFSLMKLNKLDIGFWMTDEYLVAVLRVSPSTFTLSVGKVVSNCKHHRLSHYFVQK
jgi:hypothetical protein